MPPSIVLEVLQILEAEVNLREDTRVTQQAKPATPREHYAEQAKSLSATQHKLQDRIDKVTDRIRELPDGDSEFAPEIKLLCAVSQVMEEATAILARPDTGPPAIAAFITRSATSNLLPTFCFIFAAASARAETGPQFQNF